MIHLDSLELADEPCCSGNSIDLLIGSDFYQNFVTGETKRGEEGPIAVNSTLMTVIRPNEWNR